MEIIPFILQACLNGIISGSGYFCVVDSPSNPIVKYYEPEKSCYVDGIFYPRCKDLENSKVWHYHNLLKNP